MKKHILLNISLLFITFIFIWHIYSYASDSDFTYKLDSNNNATITAYHGSNTNVTIPSTIDGHAVKSIGTHAFDENKNNTNGKILTHLTISEGITSIDDYAFVDCSNLESITLPESMTSLGRFTFLKCSKLNKINIPSNLKRLEEFVFQETGFTDFVIPEGFEYIGEAAFRSCKNLTSFKVYSDNVAFYDNTKTNVYDPEIGDFVPPAPQDKIFEYCSNPIVFYANESSTAQAYASLHGFSFELLLNEPTSTPDPSTPSTSPSDSPTSDNSNINGSDKNPALNTNIPPNKTKDSTTSKTILPRAGYTYILLLTLLIVLVIAFALYHNYKKSKEF